MGIVRFDVQPYTFCTHTRLMLDNMHDTPISLTRTYARTHARTHAHTHVRTHAHTHTHTHRVHIICFFLPLFLRVSPANTGRAVMSPLTIYLRFVTTRSILLHWEWKMAIVFITHFASWTHQYAYNQCNTSHRPPVYQELTLAVYHICTTWLARYTNTAVLSQWTCAAQMSNSACVVVLTVEVGFVCFSLKRGEVAFWYVSDYVACL